ncbi:hypothetical protein BASA60_004026 [Batrachochytrium salamandrivorans]|nr:hypothetical protein BASA60_004026 [Batrachochytrium salamandrivorans]
MVMTTQTLSMMMTTQTLSMMMTTQTLSLRNQPISLINEDINSGSTMVNKPSGIINKIINRPSSMVNKIINRPSSIFDQPRNIRKPISMLDQLPPVGQPAPPKPPQPVQPDPPKPPQPVKPDPPTPQPPYVKVTSTSDECGKIADDNGMTPFKEWGKLTDPMRTTWGQQGCDQKMCQYWAKKYNIKPLESSGSMPEDLNPIWNHEMMQCNFRAGPYSPAQCEAVSLKFRTLPIGIWGATPEYVKPLWTQGNCDVVMCGIWKKQFNVVKGETYGTMSDDFKRIWDDPGLLCNNHI